MPLLWRRGRRRVPEPDRLHATVDRLSAGWGLTVDEHERLAWLVERFLRSTTVEAARGFQVDDLVRTVIATRACRLLVGIDLDGFDDVSSVIVHASTVVTHGPRPRGGGLVSEGPVALLGEAHYRGPVLLSWAAVRADMAFPGRGEDVVLHEFAHQLDMLDGTIDGTPPLEDAAARERWVAACTAAFDQIRTPAGSPVLRRYAGTNPGEFFAVATEAFFGRPHELRDAHAAVYEALASFYGQDPAARLPAPPHVALRSGTGGATA